VVENDDAVTQPGFDEEDTDIAGARLRLDVVHSTDVAALGADIALTPERRLLLGRGVKEGFRIRDSQISRLHLSIAWDASMGAFRYADVGSANGTFVNGLRSDSGRLRAQDILRIGETLLVCVDRDSSNELRRKAAAAAVSSLPVLIRGETGSGKELLARSLHEASGLSGAFVAVNCAALAPDLAATELFGHTRGAFSGAAAPRPGLFRAAEGGSLLLDEIGDLPPDLQGHLLRTLQERAVRPVGSDREVPINVRIMAATHVDLADAVRQGRFRRDLYSRVAQLILDVPALRMRRNEILRMARQFSPGLELSANAAEALLIWDWPGNVRELRALLEAHGALTSRHSLMGARDVAERLPSVERVLKRDPPARASGAPGPLDRRKELTRLLEKHSGNVTNVARELGKTRAQVYRWMRGLGLWAERVERQRT
jgi:transcriptional regulator with PAS, ATPase and Fis domain